MNNAAVWTQRGCTTGKKCSHTANKIIFLQFEPPTTSLYCLCVHSYDGVCLWRLSVSAKCLNRVCSSCSNRSLVENPFFQGEVRVSRDPGFAQVSVQQRGWEQSSFFTQFWNHSMRLCITIYMYSSLHYQPHVSGLYSVVYASLWTVLLELFKAAGLWISSWRTRGCILVRRMRILKCRFSTFANRERQILRH